MASVFNIIQTTLDKLFDGTLVPGLDLNEDVQFVKKARADASNFDFTTGKPGEAEGVPVDLRGPMVPYDQTQVERSGGLIKQGDVRGYFELADIPLFQIGDQIIWLGETYTAIEVRRHRLQSTTLVWEVQLRN